MSESSTRKYSSVGFAILNHWLSTQGLLYRGYLQQGESLHFFCAFEEGTNN